AEGRRPSLHAGADGAAGDDSESVRGGENAGGYDMSIRKLPKIEALVPPKCLQWEEPDGALARWSPEIRAADDSGISILGHIGESFDGSGVTARRIAAALRSSGEKDVTVAINSPGGDFFEGVAIYNLLREHKAKVTVKVMGLAASAASVIAMAG